MNNVDEIDGMQEAEGRKRDKRLFSIMMSSVSLLLVCATLTFAWVSMNRKVERTGLSMALSPGKLAGFSKMDNGTYSELSGDGSFNGGNQGGTVFLPGAEMEFTVGLMNVVGENVTIDKIGFEDIKVWTTAAGGYNKLSEDYDENPVYDEDKKEYVYYGEAASAYVVDYTIYKSFDVSEEGEISLGQVSGSKVELTGQTPVYLLSGHNSATVGKTFIAENLKISLKAKQAIVFTVAVKLNDTNTDQSALAGFGTEDVGGTCKRTLYVELKD